MTWLEIIWVFFWRSLAWRQHEQPYRGASKPLPILALRPEAAWGWTMIGFRHLYREPLSLGVRLGNYTTNSPSEKP